MLVACRLAGPSALEAYYAGVRALCRGQSACAIRAYARPPRTGAIARAGAGAGAGPQGWRGCDSARGGAGVHGRFLLCSWTKPPHIGAGAHTTGTSESLRACLCRSGPAGPRNFHTTTAFAGHSTLSSDNLRLSIP